MRKMQTLIPTNP